MNPLVERYGEEKRWVNWRLEERKGKTTKVPYQINGRMASSTDPATWATHAAASIADPEHVGIVLHDKKLVVIDIDHVLEDGKIVHPEKTKILLLLSQSNTYTEISPSGTGLHIYIACDEPVTLTANKKAPFEVYTTGRYLTVTGIPYGVKKRMLLQRKADVMEYIEKVVAQTENAPLPLASASSATRATTVKNADLNQHSDDTTILERMFASTKGADIEKLYNGDLSAYKDDHSRADAALLSHLAFWTQKNPDQMERIWVASPLGSREKTQKRAPYRNASIKSAIKACSATYNPLLRGESGVKIDDPSLDLLYTYKDKVRSYYRNTENVTRILSRHPEFAGTLRFDEYRNLIERRVPGIITKENPDGTIWRNLEDRDAIELQTRISVLFSDFAHIGKDMVYDAMVKVAYDHVIDSGADYIRGLKWDGITRLEEWIPTTYHTPNDEYHRAISANYFKGMVKRIIDPGCKFDYVLVLEGPQGIRKSTSLSILAGNLGYAETTMSTETKDFFMQFLGNAIIEFSEGETLSRTEVKRMKAIITVQVDKFRQPYGRAVVAHPRRCVFAMTTNQQEYLKDETGNRRWLPVAVQGQVDTEWITANREQLLAEAYYRVAVKHEKTWEFPEKEMEFQQDLRRVRDANMDGVVNWFVQLPIIKRNEGVTTEQAFMGLHNGFSGAMTKMIEMGIADTFKTVLKLERRRVMIGGIRATRWYATDETNELMPQPVLSPLAV